MQRRAASAALRVSPMNTPLIPLPTLFPKHSVFAKCEFLAPSGCFKIRGATHLLEHLARQGSTRQLIVPSMGNTALGAATAAQAFGFAMTGVVPQAIARAKDEKLRALGVDLVKIAGGSATCCAAPPSSPGSATAISCIPTWTRSGPT